MKNELALGVMNHNDSHQETEGIVVVAEGDSGHHDRFFICQLISASFEIGSRDTSLILLA
jgi:hypothetical protein